MVEAVQEALARLGIDDEVVAAGMFFPRGHTGAMFAGGLVAVSAATVYGFGTHRERERVPTDLLFRLPRSRLEVRVHPRVNVRVLELIDETTSSRVELEGERLPGFHVSDVIDALRS
jgi:hypothetical protein